MICTEDMHGGENCDVWKPVLECSSQFVQAGHSPGASPGSRTGNVNTVRPTLALKLLESKGNSWLPFHGGAQFGDKGHLKRPAFPRHSKVWGHRGLLEAHKETMLHVGALESATRLGEAYSTAETPRGTTQPAPS